MYIFIYLILLFPREGKEIANPGWVRDWNNTGYSQMHEEECKYGLKSFKIQHHVLHTFITYITLSSRTRVIYHVVRL